MTVVSSSIEVNNRLGLHARPGAQFVEVAQRYESDISLRVGDRTGNGKSIIGLLGLGVVQGSVLEITASGPDSDEAVDGLTALLARFAADEAVDRASPRGIGVSPGRVCAPAFLLEPAGADSSTEDDLVGPSERHRVLDEALDVSRDEIDELIGTTTTRLGPDAAAIFEAHRLILDDVDWLGAMRERIDVGAPLPVAVSEAAEQMAELLRSVSDEYLRERAGDVLDVAHRLLVNLGFTQNRSMPDPGHPPVVLVASELAPSDTMKLPLGVVAGIATELGTRTSHAAILARQLGIPAVCGVPGLVAAVTARDLVAIDGQSGECEVDPSPATVERYRSEESAIEVRSEPVATLDGAEMQILANAATHAEVERAMGLGADGVGLFRTEFLFHAGCALDDEDGQTRAYLAAIEAAKGRPVTFRTMDIGGDKPLDGLPMDPEANPFLGVRGVRLSLRRPEIFRTQLRALGRAALESDGVRVMVPMISGIGELRQVRQVLEDVPGADRFELGTMIEVPSAALLAGEILEEVDFVSVGTNDLTQYVLAADRTNPELGDLYHELHPGLLRILAVVVEAGRRLDKPVGVCGEIAGDVRAVPLLVGMGFRSLSVAPPLVPHLKARVATLSAGRAGELASAAARARTVAEVEALLSAGEGGVAP